MNNSDNKSRSKIFNLKNILKCLGYLWLLSLIIESVPNNPAKAVSGLLCAIVIYLELIIQKLSKILEKMDKAGIN